MGQQSWFSDVQEQFTSFLKKTVLYISFYYTQQPLRIKQVLSQVYTNNLDNIDDALIESIRHPSLFPDAPEVFFRVVTGDKSKTVNRILKELATGGSPLPSSSSSSSSSSFSSVPGSHLEKESMQEKESYNNPLPLLLLWGKDDPWIRIQAAQKISNIYTTYLEQYFKTKDPASKTESWDSLLSFVSIEAGHCPHDERPEEVNQSIIEWMKNQKQLKTI